MERMRSGNELVSLPATNSLNIMQECKPCTAHVYILLSTGGVQYRIKRASPCQLSTKSNTTDCHRQESGFLPCI
eukprot:131047-Pelagomonas_calceolata.AAC.5